MSRIELVAHRVGTEDRRERVPRRDHLHRRERTGIGEYDAHAIVQIENEPGEAWKIFFAATDDPVTGHPEVDVQHGPVIEHRQLVLAMTLDARDSAADQAPQTRFAEIPADVRVKHPRAHDVRADSCASECPRGMLDLGKLRHERQRILAAADAQARAIDSAARGRRV